jgi:excinuclease ABC subunit C
MAIQDLKRRIARLPEQPGVYIFQGAAGEPLYVGKARVLRDRVRSYLGAQGTSPRIDALLRDAASLDVIVTDSVVEALALENRLIKQRNPRFNVLLRDDKTYPYLQLTVTEHAPRLLVARRVERDGNVYAGPFMPAQVARRTMSLAHRLFGIRSCNEVIDGARGRPCLEYDIKRCLAPCVENLCTIGRYRDAVEQARLLIEGRQDELVGRLRAEMQAAADAEQFERAAHLRDAIRTIETLRDRQQKMDTPGLGDRDAFGVKLGAAGAVIEVFQMRRGRVVDRTELVSEVPAGGGPRPAIAAAALAVDPSGDGSWSADAEGEVLAVALQQFYAEHEAPAEVHVPSELAPDDRDAIEAWLSERAGRRVRVTVPQRGDKRALLDLATRNAAMAYQAQFGEGASAAFDALDALRGVLALPTLPRRIDCFDISTLHGRETVASMVVAVEGRMRKGEYRKFRIRGLERVHGPSGQRLISVADDAAQSPDGDIATSGDLGRRAPVAVEANDFAAMYEVVLRRYRKVLEQGGPFPDLIVIDGGKGQLTAAYEALAEIGLERLIAIGLAKQEEIVFTRDRQDGIVLPRESTALRLLQRVRDEAHRFAVTFHRQARTRRDLRSALDDIAGIGPRRRKQLLSSFGSVAGVRRASREELTAVVGARAAEAVLRHFGGH